MAGGPCTRFTSIQLRRLQEGKIGRGRTLGTDKLSGAVCRVYCAALGLVSAAAEGRTRRINGARRIDLLVLWDSGRSWRRQHSPHSVTGSSLSLRTINMAHLRQRKCLVDLSVVQSETRIEHITCTSHPPTCRVSRQPPR